MSRFLQLLRWELLLSKRQIATMALAFLGLVVIPQILALIIKNGADSSFTTGKIAFGFLIAYLVLCGATIFSSLRSRQQRINNFMLPASNKEKFFARYLVLVVAMPVAAIIGFLAGDLVQHLLTMVFGNNAQWAASSAADCFTLPSPSGHLLYVNGQDYIFNSSLALLMTYVSLHACFLFFGSIFHKHPLILALLSWMFLSILFLAGGAIGAQTIREILDSGYTIIIYNYWLEAATYIIDLIIIAFCYRFSFRRYTRLQVINNQWINR